MRLLVKKLNNEVSSLPSYGSVYAAGLDICSAVDMVVPPLSRVLVPTGVAISWSGEGAENFYMRVAPRSGLSVKKKIDIGAGVIDYDYRGEVFVCFINNSTDKEYSIQKGDRIAQLILTRIERVAEIEWVDDVLDKTERGESGFGSTGI